MKNTITNKHYYGKDPFLDWAVIFVVTCLISVALVVAGVYAYNRVDADLSAAKSERAVVVHPKVDPNTLENAVKVIEERAAELSKLRK